MTEPPRPRKTPKQSRSVELVSALKQACLKLLEEEGSGSITVARLCAESGVTSASFYEYFPNIESLIAAVLDDKLYLRLQTLFDEAQNIPEETPLIEVIRKVVETCVIDRMDLYNTAPDIFVKYIEHYEATEQFDGSTLFTPDVIASTKLLLSRFEGQISTTDFDKAVSIFVAEIKFLTRWIILERQYPDSIGHSIELFSAMLASLFDERRHHYRGIAGDYSRKH